MGAVYEHSPLTGEIINAFYAVYNTLGAGFLEKVYENALVWELTRRGHQVRQQQPITVWYEGVEVGSYFADLVVEDTVIVELKVVDTISPDHEAQLLNYLKATGYGIGLLFNFGKKPEIKRKVRHLPPTNPSQRR